MYQNDQFNLFWLISPYVVRPWKHNSKNRNSQFSGEEVELLSHASNAVALLERAANGESSRSIVYGSLFLCLSRAESFFIQRLSAPPPPSHQTAWCTPGLSQNELAQLTAGLWAGTAFSEINERNSVFLRKPTRSCQLYACSFTWLLRHHYKISLQN